MHDVFWSSEEDEQAVVEEVNVVDLVEQEVRLRSWWRRLSGLDGLGFASEQQRRP